MSKRRFDILLTGQGELETFETRLDPADPDT